MSSNPVRAFAAAVLVILALGEPGRGAPTNIGTSPIQPDGGLSIVQYDMSSCVGDNPNVAYYVTQSPTFELPLILSEPTGSSGSISYMAYAMTTSMGSVGFSGSQTTGGYSLTFAAGGLTEFYPGWLGKRGLTYLVLPSNLEVGTINQVTPFLVEEIPGRGDPKSCWLTFLTALGLLPLGGFLQPPLQGDPDLTLTTYRDEVLAATPEGQYYIDLYNQYSLDMIRATVAQPCVFSHFRRARDPWITAIGALCHGDGDGVVITQQMEDDLNGMLDTFESHRGGLGSVVAIEREKLHLDAIAGLSMTAFQDQVETLGGPTSVEAQSWGRLKTLYR